MILYGLLVNMALQTKKYLYLVRGLPGSGKTTLVNSIKQAGDVSVAADDFMVNDGGEYVFDWRKLGDSHKSTQRTVEDSMKENITRIFVHNTFIKEEESKPYFDLARKYTYQVFSIIVENRHGGESIRAVPTETLEKYRQRFEISL